MIIHYLQVGSYVPATADEWKEIKDVFVSRWNFPNFWGAIDGKHMHIIRPCNSGSEFFNLKSTFSIILFSLVDGEYCFRYIDVGANGRAGDAAVFRESKLNNAMLNNSLKWPEWTVIISLRSSTVDLITKAPCTLYNWLRLTSLQYLPFVTVDIEDETTGTIQPLSWRTGNVELPSVAQSNCTLNAWPPECASTKHWCTFVQFCGDRIVDRELLCYFPDGYKTDYLGAPEEVSNVRGWTMWRVAAQPHSPGVVPVNAGVRQAVTATVGMCAVLCRSVRRLWSLEWRRDDHRLKMSSFQYKIDVKHVYTEVDFAIGSQFIRNALDNSEPIADLRVLAGEQFNVGTRRLVVRSQRDRSTSSLVYGDDGAAPRRGNTDGQARGLVFLSTHASSIRHREVSTPPASGALIALRGAGEGAGRGQGRSVAQQNCHVCKARKYPVRRVTVPTIAPQHRLACQYDTGTCVYSRGRSLTSPDARLLQRCRNV
ncbi:hypothetical protein PR048_024625 [Dryococelus australis]|uniref:DDE Tnp4 domain-containing protein n=1 Tax=Dryococelus australis TaxID=614101 RepID=A0ABQ9GP36_9NEOP|nr:hypothetical protein PR048_024625 [Dryococelus australis]